MKNSLILLLCLLLFCCGCGTSASDVEDWMEGQMWSYLIRNQQSVWRVQSEATEIKPNYWSVTSKVLSHDRRIRTIRTIVIVDGDGNMRYYFD